MEKIICIELTENQVKRMADILCQARYMDVADLMAILIQASQQQAEEPKGDNKG